MRVYPEKGAFHVREGNPTEQSPTTRAALPGSASAASRQKRLADHESSAQSSRAKLGGRITQESLDLSQAAEVFQRADLKGEVDPLVKPVQVLGAANHRF